MAEHKFLSCPIRSIGKPPIVHPATISAAPLQIPHGRRRTACRHGGIAHKCSFHRLRTGTRLRRHRETHRLPVSCHSVLSGASVHCRCCQPSSETSPPRCLSAPNIQAGRHLASMPPNRPPDGPGSSLASRCRVPDRPTRRPKHVFSGQISKQQRGLPGP